MTDDANEKATKTGLKRRRATQRELAQRDLRLIEKLAAGVTIEEIAASEGISCKWARERKAAILAERTIDRPHEFIQLQIRRLSEAMLIAYSSMTSGNVKAVDQVIKVVRELDRYHGFGPFSISQSFAKAPVTPPPLALLEPRQRSRRWAGMRASLAAPARRGTTSPSRTESACPEPRLRTEGQANGATKPPAPRGKRSFVRLTSAPVAG
jgi:hypothetical protein